MASGNYRVLTKAEEATVKEIDKDCKNKFKFQWLEEEVHVKVGEVDCKVKIGDSIVKINVSGKASCEWCHSLLTYKGKGLSTLKDHLKTESHVTQLKIRQTNYGLGSFVQPSSQPKRNLFPMFKTLSKPSTVNPVQEQQQPSTPVEPKPTPRVPLADRVASMEAMVLAVMAEHSIPLTLAPVIVDLAKTCSTDPQALSGLKLSASSAAYKIRFGLAKTAIMTLSEDLQNTPFSLNIDEATCSNTKKVLSVLVSYFKQGAIRVHHLASVEITKADSATIFNAVVDIFDRHYLPWENLISVLSDSCAVMRGHIFGVEKRIRDGKAPHLLDIDGDSCHHMQIIAKQFCSPFNGKLEKLYNAFFTDFKWCSEYKLYLSEICSLLNVPYTMPQMCSGTRWLSSYDRALETINLMDAYLIFYFAFLSDCDRDLYRPMMKGVLESHNVEVSQRKRLYKIMQLLSQKKGTKEGKQRKVAITEALFYTAQDTKLQLQVYSSVLSIFKEYVCTFQTKAPMAHKLHDMQMDCIRKFVCCFMKPEHIPKQLHKLTADKISDTSSHLPHKDIYIGHSKMEASSQFMDKVVQGYVSAAQLMFKKLPTQNSTLVAFSAMDPELTNHWVVMTNLNTLGTKLDHLLTDSEKLIFKDEVRTYVNDKTLPPTLDRVDKWWAQESICSKFPTLSKVTLAAFTVFHDPMVESTFSEMGRILNKQTNRMSIPMLNAIQTIRYELKANNTSALNFFRRQNPKADPINLVLCRNMKTAFTCYESERKLNQRAKELRQEVMRKAEQSRKTHATTAAIRSTAMKRTHKSQLSDHHRNIAAKYSSKFKSSLKP